MAKVPVRHYHSLLTMGYVRPSSEEGDMPHLFEVLTKPDRGGKTRVVAVVVSCRKSEPGTVSCILRRNPRVQTVKYIGEFMVPTSIPLDELSTLTF